MFDIGWSELLVIGVVALIVIGPKDLPRALSTMGKWVAKARGMAREFQNNVDDMVRQAELEDLRKQVQQARSFNLSEELEKNIDPDGNMRKSLTVEDYTSPAKPADTPAKQPLHDTEGEDVADMAAAAAPLPAPPVTAAEALSTGPAPIPEPLPAAEPTKDKTP